MTPLDVEGAAAPPRRNGELVFAEPWESRAFGVVLTLCETGALRWADFRGELVARIEAVEQSGEPFRYYRCWLDALERITVAHNIVARTELAERGRMLAARVPGHDHP
ncbi:MAG TPA: nitrile hydratase accessory protein [Pseudonocardiaceae bacterium]|jgi:nitrile hydratase accessory protein